MSSTAAAPLVQLGLEPDGCVPEPHNSEYGAFLTRVGEAVVRIRSGKVTPTKLGAFVAVWQRNADGGTEPFASEDGVHVLAVSLTDKVNSGVFLFPTAALAAHDIVSVGNTGGKRGFRVYPPWAQVTSGQAQRTQRWQGEYFFDLSAGDLGERVRARAVGFVQEAIRAVSS